jgi:hypothetical protein
MPFWKRSGTRTDEQAAPVETLATRRGTLPCSARGCAEITGISCAYTDRRNRQCDTAWCPAHRRVVGDDVVCRRHSGIVQALAGTDIARPDLDNRAPSLTEWVSDSASDDIAATMQSVCSARLPDLVPVSTRLHLVFIGPDRLRAWQRAWKLNQYRGIAFEVALQVAEENDTEVVIRVNHNDVAHMVPPWIAQRQAGVVLTPDEDAASRGRFHQELISIIAAALADARPLS